MRTWFVRTDLHWMLNLEQLTEERLLRAMDFLEKDDGEQLQRAIFQSVKKRYRLQNSGVIYDVTNTYLYGKKCPLIAPALCGSRAIEPNYFLCHDAPLSAQPSLGHLIPVLQPPAASRSAG